MIDSSPPLITSIDEVLACCCSKVIFTDGTSKDVKYVRCIGMDPVYKVQIYSVCVADGVEYQIQEWDGPTELHKLGIKGFL